MTATADSLRLQALAHRILGVLVPRTTPRAVLLAGSAGEGTADHFSDLDLIVYYDRLPDPAAFRGLLAEVGAERLQASGQETEESFADKYRLDGVVVETGGTTLARLEQHIEQVLSGSDPGEPLTKAVIGLMKGLPLHGEEIIARCRDRVVLYPGPLARAIVDKHLRVFPYWSVPEYLAARDARLFEMQSLLDGAFNVLALLSGLNRVYFTPFQFKRMRAHVAALEVAPPRLADRLESLFELDRSAAAEELRRLVEETVSLIEEHMPEVDTSAVRASLLR
jgi:hypothetical protein